MLIFPETFLIVFNAQCSMPSRFSINTCWVEGSEKRMKSVYLGIYVVGVRKSPDLGFNTHTKRPVRLLFFLKIILSPLGQMRDMIAFSPDDHFRVWCAWLCILRSNGFSLDLISALVLFYRSLGTLCFFVDILCPLCWIVTTLRILFCLNMVSLFLLLHWHIWRNSPYFH